MREFIFEPALNLVPEDIGLVVGLGPHESQFAICNCAVAMVQKALFRPNKITGTRGRYQDNDEKNGWGLGNSSNHNFSDGIATDTMFYKHKQL